jgi:hypothetical protein
MRFPVDYIANQKRGFTHRAAAILAFAVLLAPAGLRSQPADAAFERIATLVTGTMKNTGSPACRSASCARRSVLMTR